VSTGGQAGGPGSLQKDPIPQDLGCPEGPPGRQILPIQQHAGLGTHEKQVIARLPRHVHQFQDNKRPSLDAGTSEPEGTHLLPVFIPFL
ncbi:hypothetical protein Celaphus_00006699, partial [Cervus elaphus hippelaphus]